MLPLSSLGLMGADSAPTGGEPSLSLNFAASNTLDPRVTFSRASNATYVDSAGNLAYAPSNLLTFSEQFDNAAWVKVASTVQANSIVAPDGTTTADKLTPDITNSGHFAVQDFTAANGVVYTVSAYAKAAGYSWLRMSFGGSAFAISGRAASFNISTGVVGVTQVGVTASIQAVGGGWYRCSISATALASALTNVGVTVNNADNGEALSFAGDGVSGVYVWGAQLNLGTLQPYNSTTVKNLLGYTQEFENAAWTKSNSFIQTNLLTYSEQFDNAAWGKVGMTVTANAETAPNNTVTGDKLIPDAVTGLPYTFQTITVVSGTNYAWSVYLKAAGYSWVFLDAFDGANHRTWFDLSTGTIGTVEAGNTATITDVGNGWYRCTIARSSGGASTSYAVAIVSGNNDLNITGNGVSGVFAWGAQLVQGTTPGDYQATTTTTLPVQYRAPDGSLTADKLVESASNAYHYLLQTSTTTTNVPLTYSVYAKAAERNFINLQLGNSFTNQGVSVNLTTGQKLEYNSPTATSVTSVGSGWWRISISAATSGTSPALLILPCSTLSSNPTYTGDGTSGIYIWGAQLSDSASLDPYVYNFAAAPAAAAYYGPRFDHNPSTLAPLGLLIEEQRTNSIRNNTMQGAVAGTPGTLPTNWGVTSLGLTQTVVGTGTENGIAYVDIRLSGTTTGQFGNIRFEPNNIVAASSGQTWATSAYLKLVAGSLANLSEVGMVLYSFTSAPAFISSSNTGALVGATLTRFSHVGTLPATTAFVQPAFYFNTTAASGQAVDFTLRIGLPQLEQGATATSVIPTTTAAATRAADVAVMQGANFSNWYNPVEGTLFSEFSVSGVGSTSNFNGVAVVDDGTINNAMELAMWDAAADSLRWVGYVGGTAQWSINPKNYTVPLITKGAGAYRVNSFNGAFDGVIGVEDTAGTVPIVSTLRIGANRGGGSNFLNGYIRRIAYYPRRLSNNDLQAITT